MQDPLEKVLAPLTPHPPRAEVFDRTVQVIRRKRRHKRLAGIGVLCAAYAAGLLTVLACQPPPPETILAEVRASDPPAVEQVTQVPSPAEVEWRLFDQPEFSQGLYRLAGDLHLADADPAQAVRCYGNSLDAGQTQDLEVEPDDSWLLMAIKQARKKERNECDK